LFVTSPQRAKKFARGRLCPRAAKTEHSSRERQQGFKIQVSVHRFPVEGAICPFDGLFCSFQRRVGPVDESKIAKQGCN